MDEEAAVVALLEIRLGAVEAAGRQAFVDLDQQPWPAALDGPLRPSSTACSWPSTSILMKPTSPVEQPVTVTPSTTGMCSATLPPESDRATGSMVTLSLNFCRSACARLGIGSKAITRRA